MRNTIKRLEKEINDCYNGAIILGTLGIGCGVVALMQNEKYWSLGMVVYASLAAFDLADGLGTERLIKVFGGGLREKIK